VPARIVRGLLTFADTDELGVIQAIRSPSFFMR